MAGNMQISAQLRLDTSQATEAMRNFSNAVGAQGATGAGTSNAIIPSSGNSINNSLEQKDIQKQTIEIMSQLLYAVQQNTLAVQGRMNSSSSVVNENANGNYGDPRKFLTGVTTVTGLYAGYTAYQTSQRRAQILKENADPYGANIEAIQGKTNAVTAVTSMLPALGGIIGSFFGGPIVGSIAGKALEAILNTVVNTNAQSQISKLELSQSRTEKYRNDLSMLDKSLMSFGAVNDASKNRTTSMSMMQKYLEDSKGTGLDLSTFGSLAQSFAKYGVSNYTTAGQLTKDAGLVARYTNTDINDVTNYLGTQYRYGNKNGINNLNYAYSAAKATGLNDDQFNEFLNGLQNVIESGIANGYEKTSDEISKSTLMLASVNKNWTGENGFVRYNKIDNGIRNSVNLGSPEQQLAFAAMRSNGMGSLDALIALESGLTEDNFSTISKAMNARYSGNELSAVTAYKQMFGLSYGDAKQLYDWSKEGGVVSQDKLNTLGTKKANKSVATDNSELIDKQNEIKYGSEVIGAGQWQDYFNDVKTIAEELKSSKDYNKSKVTVTGKGSIVDGNFVGIPGMWKHLQAEGMLSKDYSIYDEDFKIDKKYQGSVSKKWEKVLSDGVIDDQDAPLLKQIVEELKKGTNKSAIFIQQ